MKNLLILAFLLLLVSCGSDTQKPEVILVAEGYAVSAYVNTDDGINLAVATRDGDRLLVQYHVSGDILDEKKLEVSWTPDTICRVERDGVAFIVTQKGGSGQKLTLGDAWNEIDNLDGIECF